MRKDFGVKTWVYPLPVLLIATYDENGVPNVMNAAWGGVYDTNQVFLCLADDHKTTANIRLNKAFTISFADAAHEKAADYAGCVSGKKVPDKFAKAGFTAAKSAYVNAPLINELPVAIECKLNKFNEDGMVIGDIVNVSADDAVLTDGKIDPAKFIPISFDPANNTYRAVREPVGRAFSDGLK